ncbi:hypothetical protein JXA56_05775 [Candidatus Micrarchaeota archaeon]|nr:hypothetical protein [Candidatus Micrarchaeota archaeon]
MESLKIAIGSVSKQPFLFVWASLLYLLMFSLLAFAAVGIFLIYFMFLSVFGVQLELGSIPTIGVFVVIGVVLCLILNGINAALAMAYERALGGEKISLTRFYSYALDKAQYAFGIIIVRNFLWLLTVGPFILLYIYVLQDYEYMDLAIIVYVLFATFIIHMIFTPALLICGTYGTGVFLSLKKGLGLLRTKHVFFIGMYILFAIVWLLNFLPFIQIATIFFAYPLVYAAMIVMIKNSIKVESEF